MAGKIQLLQQLLGDGRSLLALLNKLVSPASVGANQPLVGRELLPSLARRGGIDAMGLAVLSALPFLATLLSTSPALADTCTEEPVEDEVDCDDRDEDERERDPRHETDVAVSLQGLWGDHGVANAGRVVVSAPSDAYLVVDGRFHAIATEGEGA